MERKLCEAQQMHNPDCCCCSLLYSCSSHSADKCAHKFGREDASCSFTIHSYISISRTVMVNLFGSCECVFCSCSRFVVTFLSYRLSGLVMSNVEGKIFPRDGFCVPYWSYRTRNHFGLFLYFVFNGCVVVVMKLCVWVRVFVFVCVCVCVGLLI